MNALEILKEKKIIQDADYDRINRDVSTGAQTLTEALERIGVSKDDFLKALGEHYNLPTRSLSNKKIPNNVLSYIPEESARYYKFAPLRVIDEVLEVGIINPDNIEATDALNFISSKVGLPYQLFLITEDDFAKVLEQYQSLSGEVGEALSDLELSIKDQEGAVTKIDKEGNATEQKEEFIKEDAPVTKIVATILRYAVEGGASDIHIEPTEENVRVRFRMDGELHTSLELPSKIQSAVTARIKILASMKLDEKRKPQDGRFSATVEGKSIDFRVSTFPTNYGEKVVMRILDRSRDDITLESIGLTGKNLKSVENAIKKPYGIILISGPTGSGKSTTLYAMLEKLDREKKNVVSLEDPVEYDVRGVAQSQVRPEIGYTFSGGLRSILRQDPDIIMVGEIRDKETAGLAIQAALTGHLVLSTIHTNTAAGVVPRLLDMGVDPYLIAPTLISAIGQRLVRKLCPGAGRKIPIGESLKIMLDKQFADLPEEYKKDLPQTDHFLGVQAAPECPNGTRGRTGVFEVLSVDKEMEKVILNNPVESAIYDAARGKGMMTMKEDAIIKALDGIVPFEEINSLGGDILVEEGKQHEQG